jgi:membrane associated rhomboid family serine protease
MAWHDREYNQLGHHGIGVGPVRRPPPAALGLIILHVAAFAVVQMLGGQSRSVAAVFLSLVGPGSHVVAILLHPFGMTDSVGRDLFSLMFVVFVIWSLGGMVQRRIGTKLMLLMYVFGNLLAGIAYFLLAGASPRTGVAPLVTPAGAMAAWAFVAWLRFNDDRVSVLSWVVTTGKFVGGAAAVVIGLRFLQFGSGATAWIAAVIAGATAPYVADRLAGWRIPRVVFARSAATGRPRSSIDEAEVDRILAKISREGIAALTEAEQATLEAARREKRRQAAR